MTFLILWWIPAKLLSKHQVFCVSEDDYLRASLTLEFSIEYINWLFKSTVTNFTLGFSVVCISNKFWWISRVVFVTAIQNRRFEILSEGEISAVVIKVHSVNVIFADLIIGLLPPEIISESCINIKFARMCFVRTFRIFLNYSLVVTPFSSNNVLILLCLNISQILVFHPSSFTVNIVIISKFVFARHLSQFEHLPKLTIFIFPRKKIHDIFSIFV